MPESNPEVNTVVERLNAACREERLAATYDAQRLFHSGKLNPPQARRLSDTLIRLVEPDTSGTPKEPCHIVRNLAVAAVITADETGHDVEHHVPALQRIRDNDPHPHVKGTALEALTIRKNRLSAPSNPTAHLHHARESHAQKAKNGQ